jgi:hypothetical protein
VVRFRFGVFGLALKRTGQFDRGRISSAASANVLR